MNLDHARRLASEVIRQLRPYCINIDVAGDLADPKKDKSGKDSPITKLEIKLVPKLYPVIGKIDVFERSKDFAKVLNKWDPLRGAALTSSIIVRKMPIDSPNITEKDVEIWIECVKEM